MKFAIGNRSEWSRYGNLTGHVLGVSNHAIQHERLGPVFQASLPLGQWSLDIDATQVLLTPGLNPTVEAKTGTRRVIGYLPSPPRKRPERWRY